MKIFHTADWHIGKIIFSNYMTDDQEYVIKQFFDFIHQEKPDLIIISGDLYDRAVPPSEAVRLVNQTLSEITLNLKIPLLIIAGNHDSPERLEFLNGILSGMNLYIEGSLKKEVRKVSFSDMYGNINFYLLPFIETETAKSIYDKDFKDKTEMMKYIIENININTEERNIIIAHEYVAGGIESDSERRLSVGGSEFIDSEVFRDFDYAALGHLHGRQKIGGKVNYPGSILKYSFSEVNHKKGINCVEFKEKGNTEIKQLLFKPKKDMKIIEGYFDEIIKNTSEDYLLIRIKDDNHIYDAINKLKVRYPNVLSLEFPNIKASSSLKTYDRDIKKVSPENLFEDFYEEVKGKKMTLPAKEKVNEIFGEILEYRGDEK